MSAAMIHRFRTGRCLPPVPPRLEGGRVFVREYTWQEARSDYQRLCLSMEVSGLGPLPGEDRQVCAREALRLIRPYLPHITTPAQLFVTTAWQPFKVIFERGWVGYTNYGLLAWAKARARGKSAPWEAAPSRRAA